MSKNIFWKSEKVDIPKNSQNFRKNLEKKTPTFLLEFFSSRKNIFTYVDPKFPPDSKNHT